MKRVVLSMALLAPLLLQLPAAGGVAALDRAGGECLVQQRAVAGGKQLHPRHRH